MSNTPGIFLRPVAAHETVRGVAEKEKETAMEAMENDSLFKILRGAIVEYSKFPQNEQAVLEIVKYVDLLYLDSANTSTPPQPDGDPAPETISELELDLLAYHTPGPPSSQALEVARRILNADKDLRTQVEIQRFDEKVAHMLQYLTIVPRERQTAEVTEVTDTSGPVMAVPHGMARAEMNSELREKMSLTPNAFFLGAVALPALACFIDDMFYNGPNCGYAVTAIVLFACVRFNLLRLESPEVTRTVVAAWVAVILDLLVVGAVGITVQAELHRWAFCASYIVGNDLRDHVIHPYDNPVPVKSQAFEAVSKFGLLQLIAEGAGNPNFRVLANNIGYPPTKGYIAAGDLPTYVDWNQNHVDRFQKVLQNYVIELGRRPDDYVADALFVVWMTLGQFNVLGYLNYVNGNLPGWKEKIGNYKNNFGGSAAAWLFVRVLVYGIQDFNTDDRQITWQDMQIPPDRKDYPPKRIFEDFFDGVGEKDDPANPPWKFIVWDGGFAQRLFTDNLQLFKDNHVVDPGVVGALPPTQAAFIQNYITPGFEMGFQSPARNAGTRRMDVFKNIYHSLKNHWKQASQQNIWSRARLNDQDENYFTVWRQHYTWLNALSMSYQRYGREGERVSDLRDSATAKQKRDSTSPVRRRMLL